MSESIALPPQGAHVFTQDELKLWLAIDEEDSNRLFGALRVHNIKTVGALLNRAEEDIKKNGGEYVAEGVMGRVTTDPSATKPEWLPTQMVTVLDHEDNQAVKSVEYMSFEGWWGVGQRASMLVRDCYEEIFAKTDNVRRDQNIRGVLLTGTPGTGKSTGAIYMAMRWVQDGESVLYLFKDKDPVLLVGDKSTNMVRTLGIGKPGAYRVGNDIVKYARRVSDLVCVWDPAAGVSPAVENCLTVVVSSSNVTKTHEFMKGVGNARAMEQYMDLWTLTELHLAAALNADAMPLAETVGERFYKLGGCARHIFDPQYINKVDAELATLTVPELERLFGSTPSKGEIPALVVHYKPTTGRENRTAVVASQHAQRLCAELLVQRQKEHLSLFTAACNGDGVLGGLRGYLFERLSLDRLQMKRQWQAQAFGSYIKPLSTRSIKPPSSITLPALKMIRFERDLMELVDSGGLGFNEMAVPRIRTLESLDAVAILDRKFFFPDPTTPWTPCVVGFQMTVSSEHKLKGNGLEKAYQSAVQAYAKAKLRSLGTTQLLLTGPTSSSSSSSAAAHAAAHEQELEMVIVFVTDNENLKVAQEITTSLGAEYKAMKSEEDVPMPTTAAAAAPKSKRLKRGDRAPRKTQQQTPSAKRKYHIEDMQFVWRWKVNERG